MTTGEGEVKRLWLNHVGKFARPTWFLLLLQRREMSRHLLSPHLHITAAAAVFLLFFLPLVSPFHGMSLRVVLTWQFRVHFSSLFFIFTHVE